ncbi:hypothetical protein CR513_16529, partial [Mucuna pruriens]
MPSLYTFHSPKPKFPSYLFAPRCFSMVIVQAQVNAGPGVEYWVDCQEETVKDVKGAGDIERIVPALVHTVSAVGTGPDVRIEVWTHTLLPKFHGLAGEDPHKHFEGVPRGLLNDEIVGDTRGLYQNEGGSLLPRRSSERLTVFAVGYVNHMGRYEANVPQEVLSGVQDSGHLQGDLQNPSTFGRSFFMNTGSDLISCAPLARTTRSVNNCCCNTFMKGC